MNYIRGAVNAISAPYQYYKDLPPLNPSTLTGAIDVIVIQRPTDSGDSELVCSPFHVRFGKWQVLRPGEKKVNVSVNGHPIPFNMKIGEAGEAFFVFETDDDVPADLITSPILSPTVPDESAGRSDVSADSFHAQQDPEDVTGQDSHDGEIRRKDTQEPEFLDLDALPTPGHEEDSPFKTAPLPPSSLSLPASRSASKRQSTIPISQPAQSLPSPPPSPTHAPVNSSSLVTPFSLLSMDSPEHRVDHALNSMGVNIHSPEVLFSGDLALDVEGYHSHPHEMSDRTVTSDDSHAFPTASTSRSTTPSPSSAHNILHTQSTLYISDNGTNAITFPTLRATSEPPPDLDEPPSQQQQQDPRNGTTPLTIQPPVQEYSWEWGAFPQPSPMKTSFGKGGRIEGKGKGGRLAALDSDDEGEGDEWVEGKGGKGQRSRSVPPELEGSPAKKRREIPLYEEYDGGEEDEDEEEKEGGVRDGMDDGEIVGFGAGGRLTASKSDPTRFMVSIEGRKVGFELSLVSPVEDHGNAGWDADEGRGRRNRDGNNSAVRVFDGRDEVEAARLFSDGKIGFGKFLENESVVSDPRLVIRWAGDQYITRNDGSPLMHALILWRNAALLRRARGLPSRPASPFSDEDEGARSNDDSTTADGRSDRSKSPSPEEGSGSVNGKPTSSSWVKWWSRSRKNQEAGGGLRASTSASLEDDLPIEHNRKTRLLKEIPPAESAPALPSTPVVTPVRDTRAVVGGAVAEESPGTGQVVKRKFAKTLRLTSDQLKALSLKPGANTITFSLSTSGVIACTARIFVWDSTDLVLVSDIDGTITKSDGLGHVFAMIGRDWTHLGVAKLYTDITRNGYKVMYLTSRAIGQADATRDYLKGIKQNDYQLPEGPVIMSPDRLMASLHREVIMRKPEVFKMACLRDIQRLFGEASRNPFYAGFGNRITDALSYRSVNVPSSRIFTIDSTGEVKLELLELAGYKSSYIHMTDLVDQMFPPIHRKWAPEFTDFNYWKMPVQEYPLPDLSPPSPALSARSDTSNQSALARLRNFSLVGSRQANNVRQFRLSASATDGSGFDQGKTDPFRSSQLRQMSSFERLSSTIAGFAPSSPPSSSSLTYGDSDDEDMEALDLDGGRQRRRSMTSMPGSLDDMQFGMDDEDGGGDRDGDVEDGDGDYVEEGDGEEGEDAVEDEEEAAEEAFNEDLFAAGEMKNVPFL